MCADMRLDKAEDGKAGTVSVLRMVENHAKLTEEAELTIWEENNNV